MFFKLVILQCLAINFVFSISKHEILIIVSYDAFRYNYINRETVPHMKEIRKSGTYADYLINVFPTKTFPNHHSIATGLYPEVHGVIGNQYYNSTTDQVMKIGAEMYAYNEDIVPIWRLNEDMGDERYSGVMMWPGGAYPYQGKNATYVQDFYPAMDWFKRVDTVISWLMNPDKPANLIMFYIEEPDTNGHAFGPNSPVISEILRKLDNVTVYLKEQLEKHKLSERANVIHLSDHGMVAVTPPKFINLTQYLVPGTYVMVDVSPCLQFFPKSGHEQEVYDALKNASLTNHFTVYSKDEYPVRWHYKNNRRTPPILVMADLGYAFDDLIISAPKYAAKYNFTLTNSSEFGVHGYDYMEPAMRPFFMARGPRIKKNHKVPPFNTVDLYNLFCEILDIPSPKNNGTLANIKDILVRNGAKSSFGSVLMIMTGAVITVLVLVICAAMLTIVMIKRQQRITTVAALNKRFPQTFHSHIEAQHLLEPEEA